MLAEKDIPVYALYPSTAPDTEPIHAYPRSANIIADVVPQINPERTYKDRFLVWVTIENFIAFGAHNESLYAAYIPKGTEYTLTDKGCYLTDKLDYKVHILGDPKIEK